MLLASALLALHPLSTTPYLMGTGAEEKAAKRQKPTRLSTIAAAMGRGIVVTHGSGSPRVAISDGLSIAQNPGDRALGIDTPELEGRAVSALSAVLGDDNKRRPVPLQRKQELRLKFLDEVQTLARAAGSTGPGSCACPSCSATRNFLGNLQRLLMIYCACCCLGVLLGVLRPSRSARPTHLTCLPHLRVLLQLGRRSSSIPRRLEAGRPVAQRPSLGVTATMTIIPAGGKFVILCFPRWRVGSCCQPGGLTPRVTDDGGAFAPAR